MKSTLIGLISLSPLIGISQKIDLSTKSAKLNIDGNAVVGNSIEFDFQQNAVFKAWWKWSKEFSRTETLKEYTRHTIPAVDGESTAPVIFYSKVHSPDSIKTVLVAALNDNGLPSDEIEKHQKQISQLITDFKLDYYKNNLQKKVSDTEKLASKISKSLDGYMTDNIKLSQQLQDTQEDTEKHRQAIAENESMINDLKERMEVNEMRSDSVSNELEKIKQTLEDLKKMMGGIR
ncbi:MAG: hypothetical protein RJQ09_00465 [Cyclobacteriaceae bacterium]